MIRIEHFSYRYPGSHRDALHDVSLRIDAGEVLLIEGGAGSGKSSLARLLAGVLDAHYGGDRRGTVAGLPSGVAIVFQNNSPQLLMPTVGREISFALENRNLPASAITTTVARAASRFGLEALLSRDPQSLSEGEKQRVALAAALAMEPPLLIMDEPTAHLDGNGLDELLRICAELKARGQTTIIFEHAGSPLASAASRTLSLRDGRLLEGPLPEPAGGPLRGVHRPLPDADPILEMANFPVMRPDGAVLRDDLALRLRPGEVVALTGANGTGKSSALRSILTASPGSKGALRLPTRIGYLPQQPLDLFLFDTLREEWDFMESLHSGGVSNTGALIEALDITALLAADLRSLSGGQQQILALALALSVPSTCYFLDEPTSHLDPGQIGRLVSWIHAPGRDNPACLITSQDGPFVRAVAHRHLHLQPAAPPP